MPLNGFYTIQKLRGLSNEILYIRVVQGVARQQRLKLYVKKNQKCVEQNKLKKMVEAYSQRLIRKISK